MKNKLIISLLILFLIINTFFIFYFLKPTATGNTILEDNLQEEITPIVKKEIIETGIVSKITDGDTIVVNGENVRLLGIDADERGYPCYNEAKARLEELILNKEVQLELDGQDRDQYQRYLRYIFLNQENLNLKLVQEGLVIARFFPENQKYKTEILEAEKNARETNVGCKWKTFQSNTNHESNQDNNFPQSEEIQEEEITLDSNTIQVCKSQNYYGQEITVQGKVSGVFKSQTNTVFINFEKPYPNQCFTGVIFSSLLPNFPNYQDYDGKTLKITGEIQEYKGKPEIILKSQNQIEIVSYVKLQKKISIKDYLK